MNILIIKLGATGDVVRTTPLLRRLEGNVTWITAAKNRTLLEGLTVPNVELRVLSWEEREQIASDAFDLVISLEDDLETAVILKSVHYKKLFGAFINEQGEMTYTDDAHCWFDLSLISVYGRQRADQLNSRTVELIKISFSKGLDLSLRGENYLLPPTLPSLLDGDVAIAPEAGAVWPMKKWAFYDQLKSELEKRGLKVNVLPTRSTLLEHLADVRAHRCFVSGDSLPMHLALGSGLPGVALFTCTSPWEIYDYHLLTKIVSPLLGEFFYKRGFDVRATTAIGFDEVLTAVLGRVELEAPCVGK